jgi:hypothetical protein
MDQNSDAVAGLIQKWPIDRGIGNKLLLLQRSIGTKRIRQALFDR